MHMRMFNTEISKKMAFPIQQSNLPVQNRKLVVFEPERGDRRRMISELGSAYNYGDLETTRHIIF